MIKYEIHTEDINRDRIIEIVLQNYRVCSFSISKQLGYWKEQPENSICITIFANKKARLVVHGIAGQIRDINSQECVLVTEQKTKAQNRLCRTISRISKE